MYFAGIDGKEYNENSEVNLEIKKRFVEREVQRNMTDVVEYIFAASLRTPAAPFTYADVEGDPVKKTCPACGYDLDTVDEVDFVSPLDEENVPIRVFDGIYMCPICNAGHESEQEARECCSGEMMCKCISCGQLFTQEDFEALGDEEVTDSVEEWWTVTPWLRDRLMHLGEPVIPEYCLWGRRATGSMLTDDTISKICIEVDILEGQKNEWRPRAK